VSRDRKRRGPQPVAVELVAALIAVLLAPFAWAAGRAMDMWDRLTAGRRERAGTE
jgi:hypothetical protein